MNRRPSRFWVELVQGSPPTQWPWEDSRTATRRHPIEIPRNGWTGVERTGPYERVAQMLWLTGILFVVGGLLQVFSALLNLLYPGTLVSRGVARDDVAVFVAISFAVTVVIVGAALGWIWSTVGRWRARDPRGFRHAKGLGILLIVLGAVGLASGAAEFGALGVSSPVVVALSAMALVGWGISAATLALGILILAQRSKPEARAAFPSAAS